MTSNIVPLFLPRDFGLDTDPRFGNGKPRTGRRWQDKRSPRRALISLALCLSLVGCAGQPQAPEPGAPTTTATGTWAGRPIGAAPAPQPGLRQAIITKATREWGEFGRQVVVFDGTEESIPEVGVWEDDDRGHSDRVSTYWRAAGRPRLDGYDCNQPWSAAFLGWVMQTAGVPPDQFPQAPTHAAYLSRITDAAGEPGRYWVPRRVADYSPRPGDIVCATRNPRASTDLGAVPERGTHCDLVVTLDGATLEVIGGDVRNAVSKSRLPLDGQGRLKPVTRRAWFLILENRL